MTLTLFGVTLSQGMLLIIGGGMGILITAVVHLCVSRGIRKQLRQAVDIRMEAVTTTGHLAKEPGSSGLEAPGGEAGQRDDNATDIIAQAVAEEHGADTASGQPSIDAESTILLDPDGTQLLEENQRREAAKP